MYLLRQTFTGQGGRVQFGTAFDNHAVQGNPIPGADGDDLSHLHFFRRNLFQLSVFLHIGEFGHHVQQCRHGISGFSYGDTLKQLSHLIENHNGGRFVGFICIFFHKAEHKGA